jgi:hypothetical protein
MLAADEPARLGGVIPNVAAVTATIAVRRNAERSNATRSGMERM